MSKAKETIKPELTYQQELQRYAVNKLKALAVEIKNRNGESVDSGEASSWVIRKEIYVELLHESKR